jgi:hypothetical protein
MQIQELRKRPLERPRRRRRKDIIRANLGEKFHGGEADGTGSKQCLMAKFCVSDDEC